ncbi:MCE family protein [Nocardioides sp. SYSU DS0651]|uniref:MCE family protein n=1 Tax=Nocardioides sp. SYSU DS0651 TaxID=3415955 RepID=UPI003F4B2074
MKPLSERDPFRVGLVTLAVLGAVTALVVHLSLTNFGTREYTAVLEHTAGLRAGEDVQVHGVPSGEVTAIALEDDHVVVTFALDADIDLGERSRATVKVATLLGSHYLEIDPEGSGELADDRIPLERTAVPYNLQDVLEQGSEALDELDPELLAEALTAVAGTLGASQEEIGPALEGVARLSEVVARRSGQVGDLLRSTREVTDQLAAGSADIVGLMRQSNLVISEITARREAIHRLLVETTELSEALTAVVESTDGRLEPALADLDAVLRTLNRQDEQLTRLLEVMAPAVRYVTNATGSGPFLPLYVDPPAIPADDATCRQRGAC